MAESGPDPLGASIPVRVVDNDSPHVDAIVAALEDDDQFETERAASPSAALDDLEALECVVGVGAPSDGDGLDVLSRIRERAPTLPYLLVAEDPDSAVVDQILSTAAADLFPPVDRPETAALFRRRLALLVGHQRATTVARRSMAAVESSKQGIAIVAPDGTVQFANRLFAHHLGYAGGDVVGRPWTDFFTDAAVERVESDALPSVAEGWRWVGTCVSRRPNGEAVPVSTAITRLDDDSLVFALSDEQSGDTA